MIFFTAWFVGLWVGSSWAQNPPEFSLDQYLEEVRRSAPDLQGSTLSLRSAELREAEGSVMYAPTLGLTLSGTDDQRYNVAPAFYGTRQINSQLAASVTQLTSWGMNAKFSYTLIAYNTVGSAFSTFPTYATAEPRLELSQSLWSNGFGVSTRAQRAATDANNRMAAFTESFKQRQLLMKAEVAYWRLAFARRNVEILKEVVDRAATMLEWASNRTKLNLADRSDLLQAAAAHQLRKMDLASAEDEARVAAIEFNKSRGKSGAEVSEKLVILSIASLRSLNVPKESSDTPPHPREDVLAARAGEEAAVASGIINQEKNRPSLDLTFNYGDNGLDSQFSNALGYSWNFTHPYLSVMLKLTLPLAFGRQADLREAYELGKRASGFSALKADLDATQEWRDLTRALVDTRKRLSLAEELAQMQRRKLEHERDRLRRGRTVTSQVIMFETDSLQSELNLGRVALELLRVYAQLKLFGGPS